MRDIDRKIQQKMFSQPELDKWGVFYCQQDTKIAK
jgi:hypothetical protein